MRQYTLKNARAYEKEEGARIDPFERAAFHLTPYTGWTNDPNGFSYYDGLYHMFYQYYPYEAKWGPMHWGHAVSKDLLHWEYLPCALAPEDDYDRNGCFSGNAITLPDGRHLLMYTSVKLGRLVNGKRSERQQQCIAIGDGKNYKKYKNNPVIQTALLPKGASKRDFRDPKVWRGSDGIYRALVASRDENGNGQLLLFKSGDAFLWHYEKVFLANEGRFGKMWECPDFFALGRQHVLLVSPQDMLPERFEYHNGNGTLCLSGDYDEKTDTFSWTHDQSVDYGIDFYAPQTVKAPDGRQIMIGWMQNWDAVSIHTPEERKWAGQMSLPRELTLKRGRLYQKPVKELDALRKNKVVHKNVRVSELPQFLKGVKGRTVDLLVTLHPQQKRYDLRKLSIRFAEKGDLYTSVSFRPHEYTLKLDRKHSGSRRAVIHQRRCMVDSADGSLKLRIILDRYSVEVFIGNGEQVMSAGLYTDLDAEQISFLADGNATIDVTKYDLVM